MFYMNLFTELTTVPGSCQKDLEWSNTGCQGNTAEFEVSVAAHFLFYCYDKTSCDTFMNPNNYYRNCATQDDSIPM